MSVENGFLSSVTWSILYSWQKSCGVYFFKFSFNFHPNAPKLKSGGLTYSEPIWFQFGVIWMKIEGELEKINTIFYWLRSISLTFFLHFYIAKSLNFIFFWLLHQKYQYTTLNHTQNDKHVNNKCLLLHDFWLPLALFEAQFHTPCVKLMNKLILNNNQM